ncbi:MAG: YbaB/EbfC family nucleoid-associated protein [Gemmataceae bacterium]
MFKELGGIMNLLNNKGKIQEEMQKLQQTIAQLTCDGTAGGGMVTVKVNGHKNVLSVKISDDALKLNDREMLEDLIAAATNMALNKVTEVVAAETQKMAGTLGLPPGMLGSLGGGLPGLS